MDFFEDFLVFGFFRKVVVRVEGFVGFEVEVFEEVGHVWLSEVRLFGFCYYDSIITRSENLYTFIFAYFRLFSRRSGTLRSSERFVPVPQVELLGRSGKFQITLAHTS